MRRNALFLLLGAAGALAPVLLRRRRRSVEEAPAIDARAEELRRRLDQARTAPADEDLEVAGTTAETITSEAPPPKDEFEAMRRRVHAEARAAAERMRRESDRAEPS